MHSPSGRYLLVAASLAALAAVALLGLAADQARDIGRGDELAQVSDKKAINELRKMLEKQSAMDEKEAKLFQEIQAANEASVKLKSKPTLKAAKPVAKPAASVVHAPAKPAPKAAAKPVIKAGLATAVPPGEMQLSQVAGSSMGGSASKVDKLKAELAAAEKAEAEHKKAAQEEKKEAADKGKKAAVHQAAKAKAAKAAAKKKEGLVTADDFKGLNGLKAIHEDKHIATKAGMKGLGFMGSKSALDSKLRALHCDPASMVCSGTDAEKKEAVKLVMDIQKSITDDAKTVKAYGWKEEHALPPAPHM